jgi:starch synthase
MSGVVPFYIKTAYKDEPSFANTKVVTSLFAKDAKSDFGTNFKRCVEFREAKADMLSDYSDQFTFDEFWKLAIDYSDGVILADKDSDKALQKYAKDKNIPLLGFQGEDFGDAYEAFYDQISPE